MLAIQHRLDNELEKWSRDIEAQLAELQRSYNETLAQVNKSLATEIAVLQEQLAIARRLEIETDVNRLINEYTPRYMFGIQAVEAEIDVLKNRQKRPPTDLTLLKIRQELKRLSEEKKGNAHRAILKEANVFTDGSFFAARLDVLNTKVTMQRNSLLVLILAAMIGMVTSFSFVVFSRVKQTATD